MEKRDGFASKIGAIAALAGSAIGLGNIWRFPYITGKNGGAAFLIIYLICIFLLGFPVMMAEFAIGRSTRKNVVGAFKKLKPGSKWHWIGFANNVTGFILLSFYGIIGGWSLKYIYLAITNGFTGKSPEELGGLFQAFTQSTGDSILWYIIFMILTAGIIIAGVQKGIEKASKIMMPLLLLLILILVAKSLTLSGAKEGLFFLFKPDFSKINMSVIIEALGQAFYTLSLGMGTMVTYGSYIGKKDSLKSTALQVIAADTIVAVLAGIIIFPAVFTFGIKPGEGAGLAFITLPNVFSQLPGGYLLALLFFFLLAVAALTSAISVQEVIVAYFIEEKNMDRKKVTVISIIAMIILGIFASLSLNPERNIIFFGKSLFDILDLFTGTLMLPIGGLFISIFFGWNLDKKIALKEFDNNEKLLKSITFLLRYICPVCIFIIFITKFIK